MKAMTLFLALALAGGAWGQTAPSLAYGGATTMSLDFFDDNGPYNYPTVRLELVTVEKWAAAMDRIRYLERQVAFLAYERQWEHEWAEAYKRARIDDPGSQWFPSEARAKHSQRANDETYRKLGPCPPWPWSVPATKEASK